MLAQILEVTPKYDGEGRVVEVLTPLIPLEDTWFQATLIYDLLRFGVSWTTVKSRYGLVKKNSRKAIVDYVRARGRRIYGKIGGIAKITTYKCFPAPVHDGL